LAPDADEEEEDEEDGTLEEEAEFSLFLAGFFFRSVFDLEAL